MRQHCVTDRCRFGPLSCPGVVFFMQIEGLEDCVDVFDDYVHTIVLFAQRLNGVVLDHRRQVLTQEMVVNIRDSLEYQSSLRT